MESNLQKTRVFANKVRDLINKITISFESYERACGNYMGVTTAQGGTLLSFPIKRALTMNELSRAVNLDISTMTRMIDQLVEKGLVLRETDVKDRRVVRVGLTEAGRKLRKRLEDALQAFYSNSLANIQKEDRDKIIIHLQSINEAITRGLEECCAKFSAEEQRG
jgi:DNA-binding MarR family transcriptional regulator